MGSTDGNTEATPLAEPDLEKIKVETAQAQLRKLNLEIENLETGNDLESRLTRLIPLITAVISILGFWWGVHVFLEQQEKDRVTRELDRISRDETQYRASYEQLLQYSSNPNMTLSQVIFVRESINQLIDSLYPLKTKSNENRIEKEKLQTAIVDLINKDCDFTQTRQVRFDIVALQKWAEYHSALEGGNNSSVVSKYLQALRDLEAKNPGYLESVRQIQYDEYQDPESPLMEPYRSLIEGFGCHLEFLTPEQRAKAIAGFRKATNNPLLTADLFAESRALCRQ